MHHFGIWSLSIRVQQDMGGLSWSTEVGHSTIDQSNVIFMSNQEKVLKGHIWDAFPDSYHSFCTRHMKENMKKRYEGHSFVKLWDGLVFAHTMKVFESHQASINQKSKAIAMYMTPMNELEHFFNHEVGFQDISICKNDE